MPNLQVQRPLTEEALFQLLSNHPAFKNRNVALSTATITLSAEKHDGCLLLLDRAAGVTVTLPKATGSGAKFEFAIKTLATSNSYIIKVGNTVDIMQGVIMALSDGSDNTIGWETAADSDTITMNRTTQGTTKIGHKLVLEDIASGVWAVSGAISQSGTEATPFSAGV